MNMHLLLSGSVLGPGDKKVNKFLSLKNLEQSSRGGKAHKLICNGMSLLRNANKKHKIRWSDGGYDLGETDQQNI